MINISISNIILMGIPEAVVMFYSIGIAIKDIKRKDIVYMSFLYVFIWYFLDKIVPLGVSNVLLFVASAIIVKFFSNLNIAQSFIITAIVLGIRMTSEVITITLINVMGINLDFILNNSILRILACYMAILFMAIFMKLIKYKYFKQTMDLKNISEKNKYAQQVLLYVSVLIMAIIGILILLLYSVSGMHYDAEIIARIFVVLSLILILIVLIFMVINYDKRKALNELEKSLMEKNLKQMEDSVDALRIQRHDYMNHLQIILMQVTSGKIEDARRYILSMADYDSNVSVDFVTGNHCIDAILNTKKLRASKYNIDLTACIDSILENIELTDSEISSILLNIIDNAIDELKFSERDYKYVHVDIYEEESYYNICIKNNGSKIKDTKKIFEMAYSSKGENRGYGLYSIKKLLEGYKCSIDVESDNMETEFNIKVPFAKHITNTN